MKGTSILRLFLAICFSYVVAGIPACATVVGIVRGIVHDPAHRPVPAASLTLHARQSDFHQTLVTADDGSFEFPAIPAGEYDLTASHAGFADFEQSITVLSGTSPVLHVQLQIASRSDSVSVQESLDTGSDTVTPTTLITRQEIRDTPGADLSNSLRMVTNFVPGAYMTHDQLHIRGGHQVTWAIDGVPIPNTNIASNVGPQIDPKDIDTLEVQRGGYSAEYGDRTYGLFNVVPRTGFEDSRELELNLSYGTFNQTNNQVSFGDHTERLAWFGSVNANRSDYGLETPGPEVLHDRVWGLGGFGSLIFNADPSNQFRLVLSARRDDYQIPNDPDAQALGFNDLERERDSVATFTWVHTISPGLLFTAAPFVHFNRANYDGGPLDTPISTTQHHDSFYGGAEVALNAVSRKHNVRVGLYGFGQRDEEFIRLIPNDASGDTVSARRPTTGHLEAAFLEDQFKLTSWLTLTGGVRLTHFSGALSENAADPRAGVAIRIPRLNWTLRGFFGAYYQPPPLSTVSGPLAEFAVTQGLAVIPLKGERDQENQVGLTIPFHGWTADFNSFRQRATNYFDHDAIGNSNVFLPLSISGAAIWGQEFTLRSPRLFNRGQMSVAYSYQHADGQGAVTGGLTDFSPPEEGYFLLDHDQRHTLHANFDTRLPWQTSLSLGLAYGSGFTDGSVDVPAHLQPHTTFDVSVSKRVSENLWLSVNALNAANRRFLLDNSETFGGTHYAEPRQIYVQLRYNMHF